MTVTERLRESHHQAVTDDLTGLGNRRHLVDRLDAAIESTAARDGSLALLLVDLNGFKELNDTLGGDEFAVVLAPGDEAIASATGCGRGQRSSDRSRSPASACTCSTGARDRRADGARRLRSRPWRLVAPEAVGARLFLKIDRGFVMRLYEDQRDAAIARSLVDLGPGWEWGGRRRRGGCGDLADAGRLGVGRGAGHLLGRPVPGDELTAWLRARASGTMGSWSSTSPTPTRRTS